LGSLAQTPGATSETGGVLARTPWLEAHRLETHVVFSHAVPNEHSFVQLPQALPL
jgi:hypothetical protein